MTDYDNNLRGALFKNDKKREGKKDPDYKGQCEVNGEEFWLSAWLQKSKAGDTYMSLRLNPKEDQGAQKRIEKMPAETPALNDDIPF